MNIIDIEINRTLDAYRAECARQGISRNINHEAATIVHALFGANPLAVLWSDAFANLKPELQIPHIVRAILHSVPGDVDANADVKAGDAESAHPEADEADIGVTAKPKRGRKSKAVAE